MKSCFAHCGLQVYFCFFAVQMLTLMLGVVDDDDDDDDDDDSLICKITV